MTRIKIILILLLLTAAFISCKKEPPESDEVKIVYVDWAEGTAMTYLVKEVLEEKLNYKIILKLTNVDEAFRLVAEGQYDIFLDAWLPETHKKYIDKYGNNLADLGFNFTGARTGLVVPEYMDVKSIGDLKGKQINGGVIIGIDTLAGISMAADEALESYGLDYRIKHMSENEMASVLDSLYKRREEVIVTGWKPHWIMSAYNLKFLEDPNEIFGEKENIHTVIRLKFDDTFPHLDTFLERFRLTDEQLNSLMYEIRKAEVPEAGVQSWMKKHSITVNGWTHGMRVLHNFSR